MDLNSATADIGAAALLAAPSPRAVTFTAVLAVVLLVLCCVRSVPVDERMVVLRLGHRARLRGPGLVTVVPGLDRGVRVPLRDRWYDVSWLDATTRDAVRVTVTATATGAVRDPLQYITACAPASAVERVLEGELRRCLAERDLAQLATLPITGFPALPATVSARTADWGVEITEVQVDRIETRVDPGLVRWAGDLR
jgi:regulator of protease activity HflC (stomatin/prohibitin superfamily)